MPPLLSCDTALRRPPLLPAVERVNPIERAGRWSTRIALDSQTTQWLADLRDPTHHPIGGDYVGRDSTDRCAVGWLMERSPGRWVPNVNGGWSHTSWPAVCDRYGEAFLRRIVEMNDSGWPWPRIAQRVERRERTRSLMRGARAILQPPIGNGDSR